MGISVQPRDPTDNIISGAVETAAWVRAQGIPHLFVTNTTSKSRAALAEKLLSFGISTQEAEILTPAAAAAEQPGPAPGPRERPRGRVPGRARGRVPGRARGRAPA